MEFLTIELTHEILRGATAIDEAWIDVDNHDVFHLALVAVNGKREEVGTLKLVGLGAEAFAPLADVFPFLEVLRLVEPHVFIGRHNHVP